MDQPPRRRPGERLPGNRSTRWPRFLAQYGDQSELIVEQKALLFVKNEYAAMGLDLEPDPDELPPPHRGQDAGHLPADGRRLHPGGPLASPDLRQDRVMALRGDVFKKVVSFCSEEMDRFSTASSSPAPPMTSSRSRWSWSCCCASCCTLPSWASAASSRSPAHPNRHGWIIVVAVAALLALVGVLMKVAMPKFKQMQILMDRLNLVCREILTGLPVIRAFSREKHEEKRFDLANTDLKQTQLFTNRAMTLMMPGMMLIMNGVFHRHRLVRRATASIRAPCRWAT